MAVMKYSLNKQAGYKTLSSAAISVFVIGVVLEHPEAAQLRGKFFGKSIQRFYKGKNLFCKKSS